MHYIRDQQASSASSQGCAVTINITNDFIQIILQIDIMVPARCQQ